jgi:hypothetical protein
MPNTFHRVGDGPHPVLVLHGWFGDAHAFEPVEPWLSRERFTYVFMDYRGYGRMRNAHGAYSIAEIAADTLALADTRLAHLQPRRPLDGRHGDREGCRHRARTRTRAGADRAGPVRRPAVRRGASRAIRTRGRQHRRAPTIIERSTGSRLPAAWVEWKAAYSASRSSPTAFGAYFRAWADTDFSDEIAGRHPVKVLIGEHDPAFDAALMAHLSAPLPARKRRRAAQCRPLPDERNAARARRRDGTLSRRCSDRARLMRRRCAASAGTHHRSMNDMADRLFSVRTTCSTDGASKRSVTASTRSSDGSTQNRSASAALCTRTVHAAGAVRCASACQPDASACSTVSRAATAMRPHAAAGVSVSPLDAPPAVLSTETRVRKQRPRFVDEHVVAGRQRDVRAVFARERAIQPRFAELDAVHPDLREREAVDRVRQHAARLRFRVKADHEHEIGPLLEARHHPQRARLAEHDARACIEPVRQQVAVSAMRIVDPHGLRAAGKCAFDRRIRLAGHPARARSYSGLPARVCSTANTPATPSISVEIRIFMSG